MKYKSLKSIYYSNHEKYEKIYTQRINSDSTYNLGTDVKGMPAFVIVTPNILDLITEILITNEKLIKVTLALPKVALEHYTLECLIEEIRLTNEIEGIHSTRKEIEDVINDTPSKNRRLEGLVKKYALLTQEKIQLRTCQDVRDIYNSLVLEEVIADNPQNKPDGKIFRIENVYIQSEIIKPIHTGVQGEKNIIEQMERCLDMLNNRDYNLFIRIASFHYLFSYIHPFYDGNGRLNRFISSFLLGTKLNNLVSYRLAYIIKKNINTYYKMFKETNLEINRGDLTLFVEKFLKFILEAICDLYDTLKDKQRELIYYGEKLTELNMNKNMTRIAYILIQNELFATDRLNIKNIHDITNLSTSTIRNLLKQLLEKGLIQKGKNGKELIYSIVLENL